MMEIQKCIGCKACVEACPANCIEVKISSTGRDEAVISTQKCIHCDRCTKVCQFNNLIDLHDTFELYVVAATAESRNIRSTSSGIATLISRRFIEEGGAVVGVRWTKEKGAVYHIAESVEDIEEFRGSKYVYPDTTNLYKKVESILKHKKVLFIGIPCIVAAMKCYLGKEYSNIFYIDLICHGAPQPSFLMDHLVEQGFDEYPDTVTFREGEKYVLTAESKQIRYSREHYRDVYTYGFLQGLIQKEYCFECKYSYEKRVGDITIGDAWNQKLLNTDRTSLVALNTDKGARLFALARSEMICAECDLGEYREEGQQLKGPTRKHENRSVFEKELVNNCFEKAALKAIGREMRILQGKKHLSKWKQFIRRNR